MLCERLPPDWAFSHGITSGDYGEPPKASRWIKQSIIYFAGLMSMKLVVAILFAIFPMVLGKFGDFLLGWTEGNRKVQIAFVMFIFPLIMNAVQYYIIDIFIKKQDNKSPHLPQDDERIPITNTSDDDSDDDGEPVHDSNVPQLQPSSAAATGAPRKHSSRTRTRSFEDSSYVYSTDEDDEHAIATEEGKAFLKSQKLAAAKKGSSSKRIEEYNPEVDGDDTPVESPSKADFRR
ncbi:hypothetical protein ABW19_dt0209689 [Dactylella cylindrospora]|nr:hypothetical protein ABW19_dt0209689 [Dactylella cylindrospora]